MSVLQLSQDKHLSFDILTGHSGSGTGVSNKMSDLCHIIQTMTGEGVCEMAFSSDKISDIAV